MPDSNVLDLSELSRSARFARFLREAVAIKTRQVLEVHKYPGVVWFSDLPTGLQEVRSCLTTVDWPPSDSNWLKVARVQEPARPESPEECKPWLDGIDLDSPATLPELNSACEQLSELGERIVVPVSDEARDAWEGYIRGEWGPWANKAAIARAVKPVYQKLFAMHQQMQGVADTFDLFVGVGLFHSRTNAEQPFRRHLLAFPAEIALDDRSGTLSLGPAADFVTARIEADFLPTGDRARLQPQIDNLTDDLMALGIGVADQVAVGSLLTRLITPINAVTRYLPDLNPAAASVNGAIVSFGAAVILRPRSTRSLDALLRKIEKSTSGETPQFPQSTLPVPWRKMMEDAEVWDGDRTRDEDRLGAGVEPARVYFPLPSNEEQSRIVNRAEGSPGVVVQGPPGTGKSHTIANLISHYLALGRRVLVTAQSAQALGVLRDKMSGDLQQLCVTLLGDSRASDRDLRRSVDGILTRQQDFRPRDYEVLIERLEREVIEFENRINEVERTLHQARAAETEVLEPVPSYRGTRAAIARRLREGRVRFAWLTDPVAHTTPCPTYVNGWEALAHYHGSLGVQAREHLKLELFDLPFGEAEALASIQTIATAKEAFPVHRQNLEAPPLPIQSTAVELGAAQTWLKTLATVEAIVTPDDAEWTASLRQVALRSTAVWQTRLDECRTALLPLTDAVIAATVRTAVSERTPAEARRDLARLEAHYAGGGTRRRIGLFKPAVVKETDWVERAVAVDGLPVKKPDEIVRARKALDGWALLKAAWTPWRSWRPSSSDLSPKSQLAVLKSRLALLEQLLKVAGESSDISHDMRQWLAEQLDARVPTATLMFVVEWRRAELRLASARADRDNLVSVLQHAIKNRNVVLALFRLREALLGELLDDVGSALEELKTERDRRAVHSHYLAFVASVRKAAPIFADAIVAEEGTSSLRLAFLDFESAWNHRRAQEWLVTILSAERIEALHRSARDERQRAQEALSQLTSARAWFAALLRINDLRRATLTAWAQAVARIPATGPNVFLRRAQAQRLLGGCLDTIPAWVVSLGRLYETIDPVPGLFDVAIVDEASQCWLDSLVLFYLAKQVIIVGDDKQISPTVVGVADTEIDKLAEAFIPDLQFRSSFSLGSSLFDHGKRYLSDGVPLREHFRCVPEIIAFSNQLCYSGNPLIPLRQVGRNRLEPLKRTYLPNGLRTQDINDVEAQAVVDAIAACHVDPAYDDCDFGVICLQGDMQGERIEQLLLERLGPEVFTMRRLRCGNPYVFQGDERDVMFLSMVAAPNARQQSLTTTMYEQRFNVAMSRARDQAWLFHSIQEDELGANCLRRRVLDFFKSPPEQSINGSFIDIPHLRLAAERTDRMAERPPRPFDSWFELDVALALAARGYTLSAQVEVARKRIDLVIEGNDGVRLAVECDGEAWHGADQYAADLTRQRQLERAEWRFVRVRESLFYSDEDRAIQEVVQACEELDIASGDGRAAPSGAVSSISMTGPNAQSSDVAFRRRSQTANGISEGSRDSVENVEEDEFALEPNHSGVPIDLHLPLIASNQKEYPDPRTAPSASVKEAVLDVIKGHGPLTKLAIYGAYRDGCPKLERSGKNLRQAVNRALGSLERLGLVQSRDEAHRRLTSDVLYRAPDQPWVVARPSLKRNIEEVPLSELAGEILAEGELVHNDGLALEVALKAIARRYGVLRIRDQARARLSAAAELALDPGRRALLRAL